MVCWEEKTTVENAMKIADLKPGVNFEKCIFLKKDMDVKTAKNGPYLQMLLSDQTGQITVKKWQATDQDIAIASESRFLCVSGNVEKDGQYKGDIKITYLTSVSEPEDVEEFLPPFPENHRETVAAYKELMNSIKEPHLYNLLRVIFQGSEGTWKQFKSASAAQSRHHAYRGGLIEHSMEVAQLCDNACQVLKHMRRDFLTTCALLHDIGKLEEMGQGLNLGEFTEAGTLVGHTVSGAMIIGQAADKIENFPKNLKSGIIHMILAHHGQHAFGAAQTPVCAEAWVLHECDNMSAKAHEYQQVIASVITPDRFSVKSNGNYFFVGDLGLIETDKSINTLLPQKSFHTILEDQTEDIMAFTTVRMIIRGLVAAGSPDQGNDESEETREVVPPACGADFLVRVTGDSMDDEGIREGDLLFVKEIETPKSGDIVIAHLGESGEVVKRFRTETLPEIGQEKKWLESENSLKAYPNIPIDSQTRIRGKVVGLIRDF